MCVMVMHLRTHIAHPRLPHGRSRAGSYSSGGRHPCGTAGAGNMCRMGRLDRFSVVHLGHTTHATTTQPGILVAVPPAVDSSLNKTPLAPKTRIKLGESPSYRVTFGLVLQSITAVLVFGTASPGINAVLCSEVRAQLVRIHRFHVATYRVLHLDTITRILKRNPLNSIVVLSHYQRCCCWNWARSGVIVNSWCS
jgi:hypothetical protein